MQTRYLRYGALLAVAAALTGCKRTGELVLDRGVGVSAVLDPCPAVGVPDYTGDITLFRGDGQPYAANIDVVANITNVRSQCSETDSKLYSEATFDVQARRTDTRGARQVSLPYFSTVMQGDDNVVSKRVGTVVLNFEDGQERAQANAKAGAFVDRAAATLAPEIRQRITRKRRAGDLEAALDPLADPEVKAALERSRFEMLIGFQLTREQLRYNVTR